jgi:tetraacyldisaccharide 4'-kinase
MGPMREPFMSGFARCDIVVIWLPSMSCVPDPELLAHLSGKPLFIARLKAKPLDTSNPVVGFAAIAKPWKFRATLDELGHKTVVFHSFADHAGLSEVDLQRLKSEADALNARLITTEKDWVKLTPLWRERIDYLPIEAVFDDMAGLLAAILIDRSGV